MAKRRGRRSKIELEVGSAPELWRYSSLQEALAASTDLLAQLIHAAEAEHQRQQEAAAEREREETSPNAA